MRRILQTVMSGRVLLRKPEASARHCMTEPDAPDPAWPRYSATPFPRYRFVPGRSPHPRRDPKGHAYGTAEPKPPPPDPAKWRDNDLYLHGIDLYNFAYWWECHEALEALWHAAG